MRMTWHKKESIIFEYGIVHEARRREYCSLGRWETWGTCGVSCIATIPGCVLYSSFVDLSFTRMI